MVAKREMQAPIREAYSGSRHGGARAAQAQNNSNESLQSNHILYNILYIDFFQLPRLTKPESEIILDEVKHDLEGSSIWTPSKLVETLNKHIIS